MDIKTQSTPSYAPVTRPLHRWRLLALFIGELVALKWIGASVKDARQHGVLAWEKELRHWLEHRGRPVRSQMQALSQVNKRLPLINLFLWLVFRTAKGRDTADFFGLAVGGVAVLRRLAKVWVHRRRPALREKVSPSRTSSFPSGHAADTMAPLAALTCLVWRTPWRWPMLLLGSPIMLLIGASRIALDKHYPTDILAGWMTAAVWVLGVWTTQRQQHAA